MVYLDDALRLVIDYAVYDNATTESAIKLLDECIAVYGRPREPLTDHGSQFYSNFGDSRSVGTSLFQQYPAALGVEYIAGRVHRPMTNGKVGKFFGTFQDKIGLFLSVEELMK